VLVAEDNDVNIMVTTLRLEEMGYTFSVAKTGLEVLELLKREPFDLILMDIEMPVLDGISTTRAIRSALADGPIPNPAIPIIGVTAHALKEFRDKSLDAGMDDYVSKPVNFHELALIINRLVGGLVGPNRQAEPEERPGTQPREEYAPDLDAPWTPALALAVLDVDEAVFQGFLDTAHTEMTRLVRDLRRSVEADNFDTAAALAHTIISICASIGANQAAQAARMTEAACRNSGESPRAALERLEAETDTLLKLMTGP
jgi:CheY-like chemotaxis protein